MEFILQTSFFFFSDDHCAKISVKGDTFVNLLHHLKQKSQTVAFSFLFVEIVGFIGLLLIQRK